MQNRPVEAAGMAREGEVRANGDRISAQLQERSIRKAVAIGPGFLPPDRPCKRLQHQSPDLLLAPAVGTDQVGRRIEDRPATDQVMDPEVCRDFLQVEIDAGRDEYEKVPLLSVPGQA